MNWENAALILSSAFSVKLLEIVWKWIERHWLKKDMESADSKAIKYGVRASLRDRIRYLCKCYIIQGEITADEHEDLIDMHKAYHNLGGNGHLDTMMMKVNNLRYK
jgi:hypothetical protein